MTVSGSVIVSNEGYVSRLLELVSASEELAWLHESFANPPSTHPKIFYKSRGQQFQNLALQDLILQTQECQKSGTKAVCVIENISPAYIEALGNEWSIDPRFFIGHARNPQQKCLWQEIHEWGWEPSSDAEQIASSTYTHLHGIFEYHGTTTKDPSQRDSTPNLFQRHCYQKPPYPVESNTVISYYRVNGSLYLFLVDAPLSLNGVHHTNPKQRTSLRFKYSSNRGGVLLPQMFARPTYSLFECLQEVFQHDWQFLLLFNCVPGVLPPHIMLYIFCSSLWETNLRYLDGYIKGLSFKEIRHPNLEINNKLHDRREDLAYLKQSITETLTYVFINIPEYFEQLPHYKKRRDATNRTPIQNLGRILEDARVLEMFLMETFQLLMSTISVEQAQRGTLLTQLAFIYVPLSFITGIFGMNLREINGSYVPIWICVVGMVIALLCTLAIFSIIRIYSKRNHGPERRWDRRDISSKV